MVRATMALGLPLICVALSNGQDFIEVVPVLGKPAERFERGTSGRRSSTSVRAGCW